MGIKVLKKKNSPKKKLIKKREKIDLFLFFIKIKKKMSQKLETYQKDIIKVYIDSNGTENKLLIFILTQVMMIFK